MTLDLRDGTPVYSNDLASVSVLETDPLRRVTKNIYENGPLLVNGGFNNGQTNRRLLIAEGDVVRQSVLTRLLAKGGADPTP